MNSRFPPLLLVRHACSALAPLRQVQSLLSRTDQRPHRFASHSRPARAAAMLMGS